MADVIQGRIVPRTEGDLVGLRLSARFEVRVAPAEEGVEAEFAAQRLLAPIAADGSFSVQLPDRGERRGAVDIDVFSRAGLLVLTHAVADETVAVELELPSLPEPTAVEPSPDITLGRETRFRGRLLDPSGGGIRAGVTVVLFGVPRGSSESRPLAVAETAEGGYFSDVWPAAELESAFATVAGRDPLPVPIIDGRLALRFVLVTDPVPEDHGDEGPGEGACHAPGPPRTPSAEDLAENNEAFAADRGRCVDFTVPNRALEEVTFELLVRTTQPEIRGAPRPRPPRIPPTLVNRLKDLALAETRFMDPGPPGDPDSRPPLGGGVPPVVATPAVGTALAGSRFGELAARRSAGPAAAADVSRAGAFGGIALERAAGRILAERDFEAEPIELESSVAAELVRKGGSITAAGLVQAEQASTVRTFRSSLEALSSAAQGRFELDRRHQIDWDELPLPYQATTIAHGHLLTMKQVWRADGYSLGDLLYSLPLAPGQQKLISVLDWDRRESTAREASRRVEESLESELARDRDISDIIRTSLRERTSGRSSARVSAGAAGIGGFIGPVLFGVAGGSSSASSTASQTSGRSVAANALNQARDRTSQAASAVRNQRATVVQTARQGESVRAQTEVVANYNHCHAVTVEYFEVLRHLLVTQELVHVQECLLVPFAITPFHPRKALEWREPLAASLRDRRYRGAFDALERSETGWQSADVPTGRYADERVTLLEGELWMRVTLPRPADTDGGDFDPDAWSPYTEVLGQSAEQVWERFLGVTLPENRTRTWDSRIAPGVARRLVDRLRLQLRLTNGSLVDVAIDATLVTPFRQDRRLLVSFRPSGQLPNVTRAAIAAVRLSLPGVALPSDSEVLVESGTMRYRTAHLSRDLFNSRRILNDVGVGDDAEVVSPLDRIEKRNPREMDRRLGERFVDHLNEHIEFYHRAIWALMDANRRYLLLDGFIAPNASGRSVASVVENRIIGIVGNSLVLPVVPGLKLDPSYELGDLSLEELIHHYADAPAPPLRVSIPTRGVFAEAVLGKCNSCELIDDTRFWRWEEAPIPDRPSGIASLSTDSRRGAPPALTPGDLTPSIVGLQSAPAAPDPTGLAAAIKLLGTKDLFRDVTGLAANQASSAAALKTSLSAAQSFAQSAGALAQQRFLNGELDRSLLRIKKAEKKGLLTKEQAASLTESAIRGAIGEKRPAVEAATKNESVKGAIERLGESKKGRLRVSRPSGTVEVSTGESAVEPVDFDVDPPVALLVQPSTLTCWAAGGAMMLSWNERTSFSIETAMERLGGDWLERLRQNTPISAPELRAFAAAAGLEEEGAQSFTVAGLLGLLETHGPLWVVTDDSIEDNKLVHAQIVTGMQGDGTRAGTKVKLVDSSRPAPFDEDFEKFAGRLEASDAVSFGAGVYHF